MVQNRDNTKQYLLYIGAFVLSVFMVFVLFGRVTLHNELERDVLPHTLIGYIDWDNATESWQWPEWTEAFLRQDTLPNDLSERPSDGCVGIFADLTYCENRYELRSWFSGRLIERASEYYYRPQGPLYLDIVYDCSAELKIVPEELVTHDYNIYDFNG